MAALTESHDIWVRGQVEPFIVKVISVNAAGQRAEGSGFRYISSEPLIITAGHLAGTQMRAYYSDGSDEDVQVSAIP